MKLGLGTVQFGMDYGISNPAGKTDPDEVRKILAVAQRAGIHYLDTAALYGNSEEVLGDAMPEDYNFSIVTKTPVFSGSEVTQDSALLLEQTLYRSLKNMKVSSVYGLLAHNAGDILSPGGMILIKKMQELKRQGYVQKIGVSAYRSEEIDSILDIFHIDIIQVPLNVLDQRLLLSGHLARLKKAGIEIHARSVFLQGLLLMEPERLPSYFNSIKTHLSQYHAHLKQQGLTAVQGALGFAAGLDEVDVVLCGVNTHRQLEEICSQWKPSSPALFSGFAINDESIVNPSKWRTT
ncbi:MAG: aldo/keto reductase [Nitrospirae bacterium]|nr:aldo/keto reductase [Nitrospirota bacterium]